ncbi:chromosome partition protein MukF [Tolumonas lignilytica]|uniref:chromosome partition protein MukF n=1 Tax=Tolumonas lignilytica TaxID=1283284 RepID=UPI0004662E3C|nr:chromosome partition protein MukF [Tolumonas lignilytica]
MNEQLRPERSLPELVGWVRQEQLELHLGNERLAFLIAISSMARDEHTQELSEAALHDAFGYVSQLYGLMDETLTVRANNAVNELVRQRLLSRFNTDPVAGESVYRLTRLAVGIIEFYLDQQQVNSVKLSLLLEQVAGELEKAYASAVQASDESAWDTEVYPRLKYSVEEILSRIDLTQRAMDDQQNQVKADIADLLNQNWTQAIHNCEKLLRETGQTLRELQDTLDAAGHKLQSGLLNIQETARAQAIMSVQVEQLTFDLQSRIDAILSWGQQCIELWARYDRHVHKFIRNAIDMDKNRVFSQRLRESIRDFDKHNWLMLVAQESRLLELRDETLVLHNDEITGELPTVLEFQEIQALDEKLSEHIGVYLSDFHMQGKPLDMADILKDYLQQYPEYQHFDVARMLVDQAIRLGYSAAELGGVRHPKWKPINNSGAKVQAHVIDQY